MEGSGRKNARIRRMRERQREGKERSCMSRKGPVARTILEVFIGQKYSHDMYYEAKVSNTESPV